MPPPAGYVEVPPPPPQAPAKPPVGYSEVAAPATSGIAAPSTPGVFQRFGQAVGLPTSMDEMRAMAPSPVEQVIGPAATAAKAAYGYGRNLYTQGKESLGEVADAAKNIDQGDKSMGTLLNNWGKAGAATSDFVLKGLLAPVGGTGVENFGEDVAHGNTSGAVGDALGTLVNGLMLKGKSAPSDTNTASKLGYVAGGAGNDIRAVLPDIKATVGDKGVSTIGELKDAVQTTTTRLDQQFNRALAGAKGQVSTHPIADSLRAKARAMPPSTDGVSMANQLNAAASQYERAWTLPELNAERMMRNGFLDSFYNKSGSSQMGAMRADAGAIIDKTIADSARDVLYDELARQNPGQDFQSLKLKQGHLIDVMDQLNKRVESLQTAQDAFQGAPLLEKPGLSASVHPGGLTPRVHLGSFIESVAGRGPLDKVNTAVSSALPDIAGISAKRRAAVLALPLSKLANPVPMPPPNASSTSAQPAAQ
jgi:hypothetical protein